MSSADVRSARDLFPATAKIAYLNTAAVGLASTALVDAYRAFIVEAAESGLDFTWCQEAGEAVRSSVADIIGADASDLALIPSVSAAAGLVAAQFEPGQPGENIVIGEREFSSNYFPWRLLAAQNYEVRQVPFRNGGVEADDLARHVDGGTKLVAISAVQSATGHRSDLAAIGAIARAAGALTFVDGAQLVGAVPVADDLVHVDVLAIPDHKFLLHLGRGLGYCYFSPGVQDRFHPINAGWQAGRDPMVSFYGPDMDLSPTASRFDNSLSWIAAAGNAAALSPFATYGTEAIYRRNRELADALRTALTDIGWPPVALPETNRSNIVAIPFGDADPAELLSHLRDRGVTCAARDGNLRISVHFYNHEDDIARVTAALAER